MDQLDVSQIVRTFQKEIPTPELSEAYKHNGSNLFVESDNSNSTREEYQYTEYQIETQLSYLMSFNT